MANTSGGAGNQNVGSAEMIITGGGSFTIDTNNAWHGFYGDNIRDISNDLIFRNGTRKTDITAYATYAGGDQTQITTTGSHNLTAGDIITITDTTNYNDIYEVQEIIDSTNFSIDKFWDGNDDAQGVYIVPDRFEVKVPGIYRVVYQASGSSAGLNKTYAFAIFCCKTLKNKTRRKFASAGDVGAWGGTGLCNSQNIGDQIWFGILNETDTTDITIGELSFNLVRVT